MRTKPRERTNRTVGLLLTAGILLAPQALPAQEQQPAWPQYQHDAARSGYTPTGPKPPFKEAWSFDFLEQKSKIHPVVQAIVYQGKVFVPSRNGRIFAVDAVTGKLVWKKEGIGPALHSVGCADDKVFCGSLDGHVYALNAADGTPVWKTFANVRGFCVAPCLAEGRIFLGCRNGTFFCLDQKTGKILWQRDTGNFIYHTAAFADGRVFVGNEQLAALCLDAQSGEILWKKTGMVGMTFMNGCAFIDRGKAIFRTWSAAKATLLRIDKAALDAAVNRGEWFPFPEAQERRILANLKEKEIEYREMYAYDDVTGEEPYVLPHSNGSSVDGPSFGVCSDGRGNWITYLTVEGWRGHPNLIFARINPDTGRMKDVIWTPDCKLPNSDEANAFSVGGDILFCSEQEEGEAGIFTAFDLKAVKRIPIPILSRFYSWDFEYNHQPLCNPIAISGNRFYKVTNHALHCWVGSGQ